MVTSFYPPYNFGGDGIFTQRLARILVREGHEVHVVHDTDAYAFCTQDVAQTDAPEQETDGVKIHSIGTGDGTNLDLILRHQLGRPVSKRQQLKTLLNDKFDVIHFHNVSLMGGPDILKYGTGVKLCTLHDHWFVCAMHVLWKYDREACTARSCLSCTIAGKRPPQIWRYTGAVERAAKHVGAFIAPSEFARLSHINNGFPAPIRVLPHFMPAEQIEVHTEIEDRPAYFLFVGRLEKLKGVQYLIEQFKTYKQAQLLIAGTGAYEAQLRAQSANEPHIQFLGKVSNERLAALYHGAIAVLVPSLCFETFGLVALEGFAQGTPALVNKLGALPEIIQDGGGLAYAGDDEFRSALEKLRTDIDFRNKLGQEGLANLRSNYTQQRHLKEYYAMIADLDYSRKRQKTT